MRNRREAAKVAQNALRSDGFAFRVVFAVTSVIVGHRATDLRLVQTFLSGPTPAAAPVPSRVAPALRHAPGPSVLAAAGGPA